MNRLGRRAPLETRHTRHTVEAQASELPAVLQFMRLLWAIVHGLQTRSKRMTSDLGVTGPQRLVLRVVGLFPGVSAGVLASILHVHPSTLTGVLQRLVAQRLLRRAEHSVDRRRAVLSLTAKGARINSIKEHTVEAAIIDALKTVSMRERESAQRVLTQLARGLTNSPTAKPGRGGSNNRSRSLGH
jgi:DNA-binding MarR family transcriptional regulator